MDANEFGGHTSALPRLFSLPTLAIGIILLANFADNPIFPRQYPSKDDSLLIGGLAAVLGLHGVFTNTAQVGILRRYLSYASGVAGGIMCWKIAEQLGWF